MKIINQGAEAILYLTEEDTILKKRVRKSYRIPELDLERRKRTTRKEIRLLEKASSLNLVPNLIKSSEEKFEIEIEKINLPLIKEIIEKVEDKKRILISKKIGESVRKLHDLNIIHGDLTTSNMFYSDENKKVIFIDFGLGCISEKIEDKAVDIRLLKQAIYSKHYTHADEIFKAIWSGYNPSKEFITRFEKVESRGRYKGKH